MGCIWGGFGEKKGKERELVVEWPGWLAENQGALICISLEQVFCDFRLLAFYDTKTFVLAKRAIR